MFVFVFPIDGEDQQMLQGTRNGSRVLTRSSSIGKCHEAGMYVIFSASRDLGVRYSGSRRDLGQVFTAVGKNEQAWSSGGQAQRRERSFFAEAVSPAAHRSTQRPPSMQD
jgi:hypothetical protein